VPPRRPDRALLLAATIGISESGPVGPGGIGALTPRRWMIVVTAVAIAIGLPAGAAGTRRLRDRDLAKAQLHENLEWVCRLEATRLSFGTPSLDRRIAYHSAMAQKDRQAAGWPWWPVAPHPPAPPDESDSASGTGACAIRDVRPLPTRRLRRLAGLPSSRAGGGRAPAAHWIAAEAPPADRDMDPDGRRPRAIYG
jgi:hypothetical protein